jgi:hypothetical protein
VQAATDDAIVYSDEITKPGESAFELYAKLAKSAPGDGLLGRNLFHAIGEYSYGFSRQWDVALKVPVTRFAGEWHADGAYAELKYVAPHAVTGFYWGAEIEAGNVSAPGAAREWVLEAVPIIGYRSARWHFIANPGLEFAPDESKDGLSFQPKFKAAYQRDVSNAFGVEYHIDAGPLKRITARKLRNEIAYLTWDTKFGERRVSAGIGRGTTAASERWAAKITIELDD